MFYISCTLLLNSYGMFSYVSRRISCKEPGAYLIGRHPSFYVGQSETIISRPDFLFNE